MPLWFLPESSHSCGIQRNLVELFLAEPPAKITIPGTIYSSGMEPFRNWDWNGPRMDQNGIWQNAFCMYNKWSMHTPSGMFLSHRGVHRALKMGCQLVSWVHRPGMYHVTWPRFCKLLNYKSIYLLIFYIYLKVYFVILKYICNNGMSNLLICEL
jgi:hypothetical protein